VTTDNADDDPLIPEERRREIERQLRVLAAGNKRAKFLKWIIEQPGFDRTSPRAAWWALQAWRAARKDHLKAKRLAAERAAAQKEKA
jgi:hypothetical protein